MALALVIDPAVKNSSPTNNINVDLVSCDN